MRLGLIAGVALMVAGCQPPADGQASDAAPATPAGTRATQPSGPVVPAFVGHWAAEPSWCANTLGPERPIVVSQTQFDGYENTCQIQDLVEAESGWTATFNCQAEGIASQEPVAITADRDRLEIRWLRQGYSVDWRRCPAASVTPAGPPVPRVPPIEARQPDAT